MDQQDKELVFSKVMAWDQFFSAVVAGNQTHAAQNELTHPPEHVAAAGVLLGAEGKGREN